MNEFLERRLAVLADPKASPQERDDRTTKIASAWSDAQERIKASQRATFDHAFLDAKGKVQVGDAEALGKANEDRQTALDRVAELEKVANALQGMGGAYLRELEAAVRGAKGAIRDLDFRTDKAIENVRREHREYKQLSDVALLKTPEAVAIIAKRDEAKAPLDAEVERAEAARGAYDEILKEAGF